MIEIIPSILVQGRDEFERRLRLVEDGCLTVHVDVLDGTLFPFVSWHDSEAVGAMKTPVDYEIHLMVSDPVLHLKRWAKDVRNLRRAIVHAEIDRPLGNVLDEIAKRDLEAGIAINPETPIEAVSAFMSRVHQLTVMGVRPGASGQAFLGEAVLEKMRLVAEHFPDLPVEIDGGVTPELLPVLIRAGATRVCAASTLFGAPDPSIALRRLREAASTLDA